MFGELLEIEKIKDLIEQKKALLIAGEEELLEKLPQGDWIGGTIPYFMSQEGGVVSKDKAFVNLLPDFVKDYKIQYYKGEKVSSVYTDAFENGFTLIIIPAQCDTHFYFALNAPHFEGFATVPLIGWISGVHLSELDKKKPMIFNGKEGKKYDEGAIVFHVDLPENYGADLHIVNIFEQGDGDTIEFLEDGFSASEAKINGEKRNFVEYIKEKNIDIRFPLVANYEGAQINVSFQNIDEENNVVKFYAPIFKGIKYKQASPKSDYSAEFEKQLCDITGENITFACNCILNFVYGELEGKKTGSIVGPITFGEIVYQLVNQTLVYLDLVKFE